MTKKLRFIGTGTGRCGTVFLARYLTSIGIPCTHECFFDRHGNFVENLNHPENISPSVISGTLPSPSPLDAIAESSYMAAPFLNEDIIGDAAVIHLVRNPFKVLSSFLTAFHYFQSIENMTTYERFIYNNVPELYDLNTPEERCCLFIVRWNQMIRERSAGRRYLIHRIEDDFDVVRQFVGGKSGNEYADCRANSMSKRMVYFSEIPDGEVRKEFVSHCRELGYAGLFRLP